MARVITGPGAIFRQVSEFQAPEIRQTSMDRTKEAWASPKGIEAAVGLVDLIGGSVHSGIDSYMDNRDRAAAIKGSKEYRAQEDLIRGIDARAGSEPDPHIKEAIIRQRQAAAQAERAKAEATMAMMERTGRVAPEGTQLEGVRMDYEQSLAAAAAAKKPDKRRAAALAALGAADRPRAARWSDRVMGKPEDIITTQVKRLYPEEYRKRRSGGGSPPRKIDSPAVNRLRKSVMNSESNIVRGAYALRGWDGNDPAKTLPSAAGSYLTYYPNSEAEGGFVYQAVPRKGSDADNQLRFGDPNQKARARQQLQADAKRMIQLSRHPKLEAGFKRLDKSQKAMSDFMSAATYKNVNDPKIPTYTALISLSQGIGNGAGQWLDGLGSSEGGGGAGVPPTLPQGAPGASRQDEEAAAAARIAGAGANVVKNAMNATRRPAGQDSPDVPYNKLSKQQKKEWMSKRPKGYRRGENTLEALGTWKKLYQKYRGDSEGAVKEYQKRK